MGTLKLNVATDGKWCGLVTLKIKPTNWYVKSGTLIRLTSVKNPSPQFTGVVLPGPPFPNMSGTFMIEIWNPQPEQIKNYTGDLDVTLDEYFNSTAMKRMKTTCNLFATQLLSSTL